jgi:hypothetical protein
MHWANLAGDGVAVAFVVFISTPVQVLRLVVMAHGSRASAADYLGFKMPRRRDLVLGVKKTLTDARSLFRPLLGKDGLSLQLSVIQFYSTRLRSPRPTLATRTCR